MGPLWIATAVVAVTSSTALRQLDHDDDAVDQGLEHDVDDVVGQVVPMDAVLQKKQRGSTWFASTTTASPHRDSIASITTASPRRDSIASAQGRKSQHAAPFEGIVVYVPFEDVAEKTLLELLSKRNENHGFPQYGVREWDHVCQFSHDGNYSEGTPICSDAPDGSVIQAGYYGYCDSMQVYQDRPCRYLTVLKEPVSRMIASYTKHCLPCPDDAPECPTKLHLHCPNMSFVEFAQYMGNAYTKSFSGCRDRHCTLERHGSALTNILAPNVLALPFYGLYAHGLEMAAGYLSEPSADAFFRSSGDTSGKSTRMFLDGLRKRLWGEEKPGLAEGKAYEPEQEELDAVKAVLEYDITLFKAVDEEYKGLSARAGKRPEA